MGRGNPPHFSPSHHAPRAFFSSFFFSPASLRIPTTQTAEERGITAQSVVKIYCGPSVTQLSRDFITYTNKKNHVVILIQAFRRNLKKLNNLVPRAFPSKKALGTRLETKTLKSYNALKEVKQNA